MTALVSYADSGEYVLWVVATVLVSVWRPATNVEQTTGKSVRAHKIDKKSVDPEPLLLSDFFCINLFQHLVLIIERDGQILKTNIGRMTINAKPTAGIAHIATI